jgi:hypothetical protein
LGYHGVGDRLVFLKILPVSLSFLEFFFLLGTGLRFRVVENEATGFIIFLWRFISQYEGGNFLYFKLSDLVFRVILNFIEFLLWSLRA